MCPYEDEYPDTKYMKAITVHIQLAVQWKLRSGETEHN